MTSWDDVGVALRLFLDRSRSVLRQPDGKVSLREALVGAEPYGALLLLMTRDPGFRSEFLREILMAVIDGPHQSLLLARDVFRSLPRAVLEESMPNALPDLLRSADDHPYSRLAEILVETRLREGSKCCVRWQGAATMRMSGTSCPTSRTSKRTANDGVGWFRDGRSRHIQWSSTTRLPTPVDFPRGDPDV